METQRRQQRHTKALGVSYLPVLESLLSPYFQYRPSYPVTGVRREVGYSTRVNPGRNTNLPFKAMILGTINLLSGGDGVSGVANYLIKNGSTTLAANSGQPIDLSSVVDSPTFYAALKTQLDAQATSCGVTITDYVIDAGNFIRAFANPTLTLNAGRQASTWRDAQVSVSVEQAAVLSLSGGQTCTAKLVYADNSGLTTNVVEIGRTVTTNTGTLTIGLNITNTNCAPMAGVIPAGKYYGIITSGTGTQTFRAAQEVLN